MATRATQTFIDGGRADGSTIPWCANAVETPGTIDTVPPVATRITSALINVHLAIKAREAWLTDAYMAGYGIDTLGSVLAGVAHAVVLVDLALLTGESDGAEALETIDEVTADAAIETGPRGTLVHILLTEDARVAWHANASESSPLVQARSLILARAGFAFVDVDLAAGTRETPAAVALEGTGNVHAGAIMFARVTCIALVDVVHAVGAGEAVGTGADVRSIDGARVADGTRVTRIARTRILQVTQQSCCTGCTLTEEGSHPVVARGPVEANGHGAVVHIFRAILPGPTIHADAVVATDVVPARRTILAHAGSHGTLIHVFAAISACVGGRTVAGVRVDSVDAGGSILTQVSRTVVDVALAVIASETGWA